MELCTTRIPGYYGLNPLEDIQVITPMYRGAAGVHKLNLALQQRLNPQTPGAPCVLLGEGTAYVGDKVMQIRNDYEKGVFNGDVAVITSIDTDAETFQARLLGAPTAAGMDRETVEYHFDQTGDLVLAYACSVHKSQGSEFPAIILPLTMQHYLLLQRNLLYTAVTRARRLAVLVGSRRALAIALANDKVERRYSGLGRRLRAEVRV